MSRLAPWKGRTLRFGMGAVTAAVTAVGGVARNKWIALHLGAEGVGVLGQVVAAQTWLGVAASLGLTVAVTRSVGAALGAGDIAGARRIVATALSLVGVASLVAVAFALVAAPSLSAAVLGDRSYALLLRLATIGVVGYAVQQVVSGLFAGRSDVRAALTFGVAAAIALVASTFLLVPAQGVAGGVIALAIMYVVGVGVALFVHRRDYGPLFAGARPGFDPAVTRALLGIGGAALTLALVDQGTLLATRAHYLRAHGIAANGLLQAALALSQQAGAPFYVYFANYALGKVSGLGPATSVEDYTRRQWTPVILLATFVCGVGMLAAGPLLGLFYADAFAPARPLMAWTLAGEFARIAAQAWVIGALPLAGARTWIAIGLANDATLALTYVLLNAAGVGATSLPLAYGAGALATLITGGVWMGRAGVRPRPRDVALVAAALAGLTALATWVAR
jgi:Na+-driven multidrug efflux pump